MRRRFLIAISLFALLLSMVFGLAVLIAFYWIEDRSYQKQLSELLSEGSAPDRVSHFSGPESKLPPSLAKDVAGLSVGIHELERDEHEIHVLIEAKQGTASRQVAIIQVHETANLERNVIVSVILGIGLTTVLGMMIGRKVAERAVQPVEALAHWLQSSPQGEASPPESDSEEIQILSEALGAFITHQEVRVERERAFVREASHELRTPITTIRAVCELAEDHPLSDEAVARIRRSAKRMTHTVEGLLCLAREEQRLMSVNFDQEWQWLMAETRESFHDRISLSVEHLWSPTEPLAARLLIVATATLLRNAAQHSRASEVEVRLSKSGLEVSDKGKGFDDLEAVRDALATMQPLLSGGLGLSMVERICRRLDWVLILTNMSPGARAQIEFRSDSRSA